MKKILFVLALSFQACTSIHTKVLADTVTDSTILDGDATSLAEGCGQQPSPLGMFCRLTEGSVSSGSIFLIGPPADCNRDACVFFKVYNEQGVLVFGGSLPKKQTRLEVPWKTLLGRDTVDLLDRGFWSFNTTVFWNDKDGRERTSVSQGDIVLRVIRKSYVPLNTSEDDPNFVWKFTSNGYQFKVTTGLRAFVKRGP